MIEIRCLELVAMEPPKKMEYENKEQCNREYKKPRESEQRRMPGV